MQIWGKLQNLIPIFFFLYHLNIYRVCPFQFWNWSYINGGIVHLQEKDQWYYWFGLPLSYPSYCSLNSQYGGYIFLVAVFEPAIVPWIHNMVDIFFWSQCLNHKYFISKSHTWRNECSTKHVVKLKVKGFFLGI